MRGARALLEAHIESHWQAAVAGMLATQARFAEPAETFFCKSGVAVAPCPDQDSVAELAILSSSLVQENVMIRSIVSASCLVRASALHAAENKAMVVTPVISTATTSSGQPIILPQKDAEVSVSRYEIAARRNSARTQASLPPRRLRSGRLVARDEHGDRQIGGLQAG